MCAYECVSFCVCACLLWSPSLVCEHILGNAPMHHEGVFVLCELSGGDYNVTNVNYYGASAGHIGCFLSVSVLAVGACACVCACLHARMSVICIWTSHTPHTDPHICQSECLGSPQCVAWTYVVRPPLVAACCLKSTVPAQNPYAPCTSGIKNGGTGPSAALFGDTTFSSLNTQDGHAANRVVSPEFQQLLGVRAVCVDVGVRVPACMNACVCVYVCV